MTTGDVTSTTTLGQLQFGQPEPGQPRPVQSSTNSDTQDQATVSPAAHAKSMYSSGQSVATIAASLGVSTSVVDEYLGITTSEEKALLAVAK